MVFTVWPFVHGRPFWYGLYCNLPHLFLPHRAIRERDQEIKSSRLTDEELEAKRREKARQDQQEAEVRKERSRQAKEAMRRQELEEMKPKAQSALAARWEERIRARSEGKISREENKATVLTGNGMSVSVTIPFFN